MTTSGDDEWKGDCSCLEPSLLEQFFSLHAYAMMGVGLSPLYGTDVIQ